MDLALVDVCIIGRNSHSRRLGRMSCLLSIQFTSLSIDFFHLTVHSL
jgi:hypothetical protein